MTGSLTFGKIIEVDSLAISLVFEGRKAVRKGDGMAYSKDLYQVQETWKFFFLTYIQF